MHESIKKTIKACKENNLGTAVIQQIVKSNFGITLQQKQIEDVK